MADTPQTGETVVNEELKNEGTPTSTQPQGNASDQAAEQLRKEKEQAQMRANQLENELKKIREAEEAAKQKQLEEQNEFKSLYEQEKAKREEFEKERQEAEAKAQLSSAENEVFGEFPDDVVEIAKDAGIGLNETSDEAKERLRSTLSKLSGKTDNTPKPNNGNTPPTPKMTRDELLAEHAKNPNPNLMDEAIAQLKWIQFHNQQPE
jgi:hypothetical protein